MFFGIDIGIFILLLICLLLVCIFEFINGSHDTANAVAPVIYSHSLKPKKAVLIAATMNFFGVIFGGITVAMGIIHLLPLEVISEQSTTFGMSVVISLLLTAIIWNFFTWFFGIPVSSSHTLIGSIFGVSFAMSVLPIISSEKVTLNWHKIIEVIQSLFISPLVGFGLAFIVMTLSYKYIKSKNYFGKPKKKKLPESWLRAILIGSSAWVSFAHGSNDGQKGVGLAMLILILLVPTTFAVNTSIKTEDLKTDIAYFQQFSKSLDEQSSNLDIKKLQSEMNQDLDSLTNLITSPDEDSRRLIRQNILKLQNDFKTLTSIDANLTSSEEFKKYSSHLSSGIDYAPWWIIFMISFSLGLGTMIGRKRVVKTIGKKIGNHKLNYAESSSSAIITATTITFASHYGLPVSTTHIFSSSIAGCMMTGKNPGLQRETVQHILMAWILTLPITIVLSGSLFSLFWYLFV